MAKIVLSDDAPKGNLRFSLGNAEIEKVPVETNDSVLISNAEAHPWLAVEYDKVEELSEVAGTLQLPPEDDALSAQNSVANNPDEVRKELARRTGVESDPTAIDAGLPQSKPIETDAGVDLTIAADRADDRKGKE